MTNWRAYLTNDVPVHGPDGIAVTGISDTAVPAIGADMVRHGLLFHNPNPSTVLRVLPVSQRAGTGLIAGQGGIAIEPYANFELYDSMGGNLGEDQSRVRINCGWEVVADVAGSWGLTIWNFTDSPPDFVPGKGPHPLPVANLYVDPDISSPSGMQFNLTTTWRNILPPNQNRRGVLFHNPGNVIKAVSPGNIQTSIGAGSIVLLPQGQLEIRAAGKIRCNSPFNALTADDSDGSLTALEYV